MTDKIDNAVQKFSLYLKNEIKKREDQLKEFKLNLTMKSKLANVKELNDILDEKNQQFLKKISADVDKQLEIINYFVENGVSDVEQVIIAQDIVLKELNNYFESLTNIENKSKDIEEECNNLQKLDEDYDRNYELFLDYLEKSSLSETEKLEVIMYSIVKNLAPEEIVEQEEENSKQEIIQSKYQDCINKAKKVCDEYYSIYLEGKSEKDILFAKNMIQSIDNNDTELQEKYSEYYMIFNLINLISYRNDLEEELKKSEPNADFMNLCVDEINLTINIIEKLGTVHSKNEITNNHIENVKFLLDEYNNPYFEIPSDEKNRKSYIRLIESISISSNKDHGVILKDNPLNQNVYIKSLISQDMCCSYLQITNDSYIVITFNDFDNIFDITREIIRKNLIQIQEIQRMIKNNENPYNNDRQYDILNKLFNQNSKVL